MAFARKYTPRRKFSRKPRKFVKKTYRKRNPFGRPEVKLLETQTTTAITDTAQVIQLNTMGQGSSMNQIIGNKFFMKSLQLKGFIQNLDDYDIRYVRMLLVYDKNGNQANPAITDLLTSSDVTAMRNLDNRYRFRVYIDKLMKFDGESVSNASRVISIFKRINKLGIMSQGTSSLTTGGLYLILLSTDSTDGCQIKLSYRLRYTDN